jgi:NAD(P)-dependent dehydrogenase (short-subunit alcohol dehydrogenase family)
VPGLEGKTAIVTGASSGIGAAIARALQAGGARVAGGARRVDQLGTDVTLELDVTDPASSERFVEQAVRELDGLDILVNNAGLGPENPAERVTEDDFDLTFGINVKGVFFTSQAAGRVMIRQGRGRIVSLSSQAGVVALPTESVYCMSKAAVSHMTRCLAVEWGRYGITVNAVAPTFIRTPGTEPALADPAFKADVEERIAGLHRIGEPMDVAGGVIFLASPAASLVTGVTLLIDGGWTAR